VGFIAENSQFRRYNSLFLSGQVAVVSELLTV